MLWKLLKLYEVLPQVSYFPAKPKISKDREMMSDFIKTIVKEVGGKAWIKYRTLCVNTIVRCESFWSWTGLLLPCEIDAIVLTTVFAVHDGSLNESIRGLKEAGEGGCTSEDMMPI